MQSGEFNEQINRLKTTYGDKNYPDERITAIWNETRNLDFYEFENVITRIIGAERYAPMVDKIKEYISGYQKLNYEQQKMRMEEEMALNPCKRCGGTGFVIASHRNIPSSDFAFRCSCKAAEFYVSKKIPLWSNSYLQNYQPKYEDWSAT